MSRALSETEIQSLEVNIPAIAAQATHAAFIRALAAGHAVLTVQNSLIVELKADGSARVVGETKPRHKVVVGEVIKVRRL